MKYNKVLVTGANGYIGRHVVYRLLEMGHEVYVSDIIFDKIDGRAIRVSVPLFSGDENIYQQLLCPDVCIHLAWRDGFKHDSHAHMEDLSKHYIFIKNMLKGGLKSISIMGSMHEVGYWEGAVDETTPTNPLSLYGIAKNSLRQATELLAQTYNTSFKWLRAYYVLGDDLYNNSIFSKLIKMENEGKEFFPFNTGKNKYDFIDISILAKQIAASSMQDSVEGVINCCSGVPVSLSEKVEEYIRNNNLHIKLQYGQFPDRPYDSPAIWGDNEKIKKIMSNYESGKYR